MCKTTRVTNSFIPNARAVSTRSPRAKLSIQLFLNVGKGSFLTCALPSTREMYLKEESTVSSKKGYLRQAIRRRKNQMLEMFLPPPNMAEAMVTALAFFSVVVEAAVGGAAPSR